MVICRIQMNNPKNTEKSRFHRGYAFFSAFLLLISLAPIAMVAPFVRSTGDDLNYSAGVHHALAGGEGWRGVLAAVFMTVKNTWHSWQGTWSSVALFSLQPGIWGNQYYPITVLVALVCILGGTGYFLHVVGSRRGIGRSTRIAIFSLTGLLLIQYMPNMQCGLFWWTSVAHYCIPYGVTLLCMGWSLRFLDTGRRAFLVGCCLGMTYLGGAGYPEVVLGAVWLFLLLLVQALRSAKEVDEVGLVQRRAPGEETAANGRRTGRHFLWLMLPLALEMAGFAVSAVSPGNRNRGGESFGFSAGKVLWTLAACVREGLAETAVYSVRVRPLLPVLVILVLLLLPDSMKNREKGKKNPAAIPAAGFVICIVRAPVLYAGTDASGGVPDSYWFITVTALVWLLETLLGPQGGPCGEAVQSQPEDGSKEAGHAVADATTEEDCAGDASWENAGKGRRRKQALPRQRWYQAGILLISLLLLLMFRHIVGSTVDYTCVQFIRSGALADYHTQMEEWLDILENPEITEAQLPAMNDEQGPFMLMVPLDDETAWSSSVYAAYYGKQSVVCVPRE